MDTQAENVGSARTIRSIERAIDVLSCFTRDAGRLSVTDLQKRLGLSRPTLYRILMTLEEKGLIRSHGEPQRFELGHRAAQFARNWIGGDDFLDAARPHLRKLWQDTDETVALLVAGSAGEKICIEELPSRQPLTFARGVGFTESLTIGASGKAILAFMSDAPAELGDIRRAGVCVSESEVIEGAVAIAAPVFGSDGRVRGSVCVFGPEVRLVGARRADCTLRVIEAAAAISRALGNVAPAAAAE